MHIIWKFHSFWSHFEHSVVVLSKTSEGRFFLDAILKNNKNGHVRNGLGVKTLAYMKDQNKKCYNMNSFPEEFMGGGDGGGENMAVIHPELAWLQIVVSMSP